MPSDKERLNWLDRTKSEVLSRGSFGFSVWPSYNTKRFCGRGIRSAIDAAIRAERRGK